MKNILVGLDGSPVSRAVLSQGIALARATGAKLTLLRVVGLPVDLPKEAFSSPPDDLARELEGMARLDLKSLAEAVPQPLLAGTRVELGSPWQGILRAAREVDADLIVIGSHGHTLLDRILGSTATRVVNHADRSVLVVRPPAA